MAQGDNKQIQKTQFDIPVGSLKDLSTDSIDINANASDALELMRKSATGCLCVLRDRLIVGIITEKDFLQKGDIGLNNWAEIPIESLMSKNPITLPEDSLISDVIKLMAKRDFRHVPLRLESGEFKAVVSIKNLMAFIVEHFPEQVASFGTMTSWEALRVDNYSEDFSLIEDSSESLSGNIFMTHLSRVCDQKPLVLAQDATIAEVVAGLKGRRKGSLLLMEYETCIKGIITERDLLFKVYDQPGIDGDSMAQDFMTSSPHLLLSKHYLAHAINNMFHYKYRSTIIVNEDRYPIAIVSLLEIFKFMAFHFYAEEISLMKKDASGNVIL